MPEAVIISAGQRVTDGDTVDRVLYDAAVPKWLSSHSSTPCSSTAGTRCSDLIVISGEVGLRKPDRANYEVALDRLVLPAGRVLFLDAEPTVLGARTVGLQPVDHLDAASTRTALAVLVAGLRKAPPTVDTHPSSTGVVA